MSSDKAKSMQLNKLNKWNYKKTLQIISCRFQDLPNRMPYKLGNIKFLWKSLPLKCLKKKKKKTVLVDLLERHLH